MTISVNDTKINHPGIHLTCRRTSSASKNMICINYDDSRAGRNNYVKICTCLVRVPYVIQVLSMLSNKQISPTEWTDASLQWCEKRDYRVAPGLTVTWAWVEQRVITKRPTRPAPSSPPHQGLGYNLSDSIPSGLFWGQCKTSPECEYLHWLTTVHPFMQLADYVSFGVHSLSRPVYYYKIGVCIMQYTHTDLTNERKNTLMK